MAIPTFGGMALEVVTMLVVPVLYCGIKEFQLKRKLATDPHRRTQTSKLKAREAQG
jgi:hypothetical protein